MRQLDNLGTPVWRVLEPYSRKILPVDHPIKALLFGVIWGWLPCGLVYYVLLLSVSAGGAFEGALCMFGFGIGTLPSLIGTGYFMGRISHISRHQGLRIAAGLFFVLLGLYTLLFNSASI